MTRSKRPRIFGTSVEAIEQAEDSLGRSLPSSLREWLLQNNGRGVGGVTIFPVLDPRDPRMTWNSIDRRFHEEWAGARANFADEERDFDHLLPFADFGVGDYYCFDYARQMRDGEAPVVRWSHETGDTQERAASFAEFLLRLRDGAFDDD